MLYWLFWHDDIRWAFDGLREYADRLEAQIEHMAAADQQRLEDESFDPEEDPHAGFHHQLVFDEALPRNLRYSGISLLLTTIDTTLLRVCRALQHERQLRLAVRDLAGRPPYKKALAYIEKVAGISLPKSPFRSTLADLVTVRNCIVHGAGNVDFADDPREVRAAAQRLTGFTVLSDGSVQISDGVCTTLINQASAWIDEVINATGLIRRSRTTDEGAAGARHPRLGRVRGRRSIEQMPAAGCGVQEWAPALPAD